MQHEKKNHNNSGKFATSIIALWLTHIVSQQEQLKQRDQSLRKQEQEMDSLSFRNQQLAKRVELLQEELAVSEAKGKKGKVIMKVDQGRGCSWGRGADCALCFAHWNS